MVFLELNYSYSFHLPHDWNRAAAGGGMNGGNAEQLSDKELLEQFKEVERMDEDDRSTVKKLIDAFITKKKVQKLAG